MTQRDIAPLKCPDAARGLLMAMLENATHEWRTELPKSISPDAIGWQPFPNGHSIGALILHLVDVEAYWIEQIGAGRKLSKDEVRTYMSDQINQYGIKWPTPPKKPLSYYYSLQDEVRQRTLKTITETDLFEVFPKRMPEAKFSGRWLLSHVINHESYTGGQIVLLYILWKKLRARAGL